jgi:molecular chaperone HscB
MTNYFELYELPVGFHPDATAVKNKFYELSRRYHPDRFAQADDVTRAEVLRMSALNNDAYKTLNNSDAITSYILKLNNLLEEEEKYNLPPAFLMEMMDLNEVVSDYELDINNEALKQQAIHSLQEQLAQWDAEVRPLTDRHDTGTQTTELLLQIKDYYFRKKYLLRIQERINKFAAR